MLLYRIRANESISTYINTLNLNPYNNNRGKCLVTISNYSFMRYGVARFLVGFSIFVVIFHPFFQGNSRGMTLTRHSLAEKLPNQITHDEGNDDYVGAKARRKLKFSSDNRE